MKSTSTFNVTGLIALVLLGMVGAVSNAYLLGVHEPIKLISAGVTGATLAVAAFLTNKRKGTTVDLSRIPIPIQDLLIAIGEEIKAWRVEQKQQERIAAKAAEEAKQTAAQQAAAMRAEADRLEAEAAK